LVVLTSWLSLIVKATPGGTDLSGRRNRRRPITLTWIIGVSASSVNPTTAGY